MTFQVYYTHRAQLDSSFVNRAWYDADYCVLALELSGSVYRYDDVSRQEYDDMVTADSPGTYYRNVIQGRKSGHRFGPVADLVEEFVGVKPTHIVKVQGKAEPVRVFATTDGSAVADSSGALSMLRVPLAVYSDKKEDEPERDNHTVYFTVGEDTVERAHTLKANGVDDAIDKMFELAELLNQDISVKGVLIRFD